MSLNKFLDRVEDCLAYLAGAILVFLSLATAYDVVVRKISDLSAPWVVEVSEVGMVYATFLSAAWIMRLKGHVSMDTFVNMVSLKTQKVLTVITLAMAVASLSVIVWSSLELVADAYTRGLQIENMISIPRWLALSPITLGSALLALECLRKLVQTAAREGDV